MKKPETEHAPSELFRPQALEHHTRHRVGQVVRLASSWTGWCYWLLLVLLAVGGAAAWLVHVDGQRLLNVLLGHG